MATHTIHLPAAENITDARVGNAMSTSFTWDADCRRLYVSWKRGRPQIVDVPQGVDRAQVRCSGGEPNVRLMQPPKNPLARVAWEFNFFGSKRVQTRNEIEAAKTAPETYFYDAALGGQRHRPIIVEGEGYCFVFSVHMEGQVWKPFKWWADSTANVLEVRARLCVTFSNYPEAFENWRKRVVSYDGQPTPLWGHVSDSYIWGYLYSSIALAAIEQDKPLPHEELLEGMERNELRHFFAALQQEMAGGRYSAVYTHIGSILVYLEGRYPQVELSADIIQGVKMPWGTETEKTPREIEAELADRLRRNLLRNEPERTSAEYAEMCRSLAGDCTTQCSWGLEPWKHFRDEEWDNAFHIFPPRGTEVPLWTKRVAGAARSLEKKFRDVA